MNSDIGGSISSAPLAQAVTRQSLFSTKKYNVSTEIKNSVFGGFMKETGSIW
jgi:hypothetical protein